MKTLLPFPLVGLGAVAPAPPDFVPTVRARARLALNATAAWFPPDAPNIRAHAKLAMNANAKARSLAAARLALNATAVWHEPPAPAKARARFAMNASATGMADPTWPQNGFVGQIELRLKAVTGGGTVSNALVPVIITNPALATVVDEDGNATGGLSLNEGLDVQLEMGSTVLGYVRLGYNGAGFWAGLVNLPTRNFAVDESVMLYVGKDATDGQNAALARAGDWMGWWNGTGGTDLTGQGYDLVEQNGVTINDTLDGLPAIRFDGVDDYLSQASSTYLNGRSAITAVQVYEPEFENELRELWNVSVGGAGELGFRFRAPAATPPTDTRRLVAIAKFGTSTLALESADNTAPTWTDDSGGNGFVPHVVPMEIDKAERSGDIIVPTFNEQIPGLYTRSAANCTGARPLPTQAAPYPPPNTGNNANPLCANPVNAVAGRIYDFRGTVGVCHEERTTPSGWCGYQYSMWESVTAGAGSVICGGKVHTVNNEWLNDPWAEIHGKDTTGFNAPAIWIGAANAKWQGIYCKYMMDGIQPRAEGWVIENIKILARDDCIENDDQYSGRISNGYLQGHTLMSVRPGDGSRSTANLNCIVTFEDCVIHQMRQPYDGDEKWHAGQYDEPGADPGDELSWFRHVYTSPIDSTRHDRFNSTQIRTNDWFACKSVFKSQVESAANNLYKLRTHMKNCVIGIEGMAVEGAAQTFFPGEGDKSVTPGGSNTGSKYEGVVLCVMAPGGWNAISSVQTAAELTAMGITVINPDGDDEQLAYDTFTAAQRAWETANVYQDTTDDYAWNRGGTGPTPVDPPVNTSDPFVAPATGVTTATQLTVDPGQWTNSPTYTYRWLADGADISGATGTRFTPATAHVGMRISCRVTAANAAAPGGVAETTAQTTAVTASGGSSNFVLVGTSHWTTLTPGNIVTPSSWNEEAENNFNPGAGRMVDLRDREGRNHIADEQGRVTLINLVATAGAGVFGWKCTGMQNQNLPWQAMKFGSHGSFQTGSQADDGSWDDKHMKVNGSINGSIYCEDFATYNSMDGFDTGDTGSQNHIFTVRSGYARGNRDDLFQNDQLKEMVIDDFLCDGCHFFISVRPGGSLSSTRNLTIRNCLIRLGRNRYYGNWGGGGTPSWNTNALYSDFWTDPENIGTPTLSSGADGKGHNQIIKDSAGFQGQVLMSNCLIMMEGVPLGGPAQVSLPRGTYSGNVLFYAGATPVNFNLPSGVTTITDRSEGWNLWMQERHRWLVAHGNNDDTGNDFSYLHE